MKEISGEQLKHILIEGFENLIKNRELLNRINVFPVPDGDTGDNLTNTIKPAIEYLKETEDKRACEILRGVAEIFLHSARGNSGVIFSQFFLEFSKELEGKENITPIEFGSAMEKAIEKTYSSVEEPKEGTILTVIKHTAMEFKELSLEEDTYSKIFDTVRLKAKEILLKTKNMLPHLKKSGVVDSGGLGFYLVFEGMANFFKEKKEQLLKFKESYFKPKKNNIKIEYRYCSEWTIKPHKKSRSFYKKLISEYGDSVVVSGEKELFHVHIHTDEPYKVEALLKKYGSVLRRKIDDLLKQKNDFYKKDYIIVCDTAIDFPEEIEFDDVLYVPVHLSIDDKEYRDKFEISKSEFYEIIKKKRNVKLKTSQPSSGEFLTVYREALMKAKSVIVFTLTSKHSGTYSSALSAKNLLEIDDREKVFVIDTKNISLASGLIVYGTLEKLKAGFNVKEAVLFAENLREKVKIFIYLDTLNFIVRGGRVSKEKAFFVKLFGLKTILTIEDGMLKRYGFLGSKRKIDKKFLRKIMKELDTDKNYIAAIATTSDDSLAPKLKEELLKYKNIKEVFTSKIGPALGVHAGEGAFGVGFLEVE